MSEVTICNMMVKLGMKIPDGGNITENLKKRIFLSAYDCYQENYKKK